MISATVLPIESEPERGGFLSRRPNTETPVSRWGADERIVGRTDYCSYPEEGGRGCPSIGTYTSPNMELIIFHGAGCDFLLPTT